MTKYVIQSGGVERFPHKLMKFNEKIFSNFTNRDNANPVKILVCFFALPREDWEDKYEAYKINLQNNDSIQIKIEVATPDEFVAQCEKAEIIFLSGGDDDLLKCRLSQFDIPKIWEGKVIATSSAGSSYLAESFWTCDWRQNRDGKGIIPIRFIPHYKSETYGKDDIRGPIDWKLAYKELEEYGDKNLPIHALKEGDFIVFDK